MKVKKMVDSFNYAIEGIIYSIRTQRNMKIHMILTIIVLSATFFYDLSRIELLIITITITLVIVAEMINTAVECAIDATTNYYHPLAKIAKNVAAGGVLVTAINSVLVGYVIFWDRLTPFNITMMSKLKKSNPDTVFFILVIVCISAVVVKSIYDEGTPFRGGMPSGHSTLAFSVATAITLLTNEPLIMVLSYLLAVIVAQSRVDSQIHSILEVIFGGIFGTLLTLLLFKVLG